MCNPRKKASEPSASFIFYSITVTKTRICMTYKATPGEKRGELQFYQPKFTITHTIKLALNPTLGHSWANDTALSLYCYTNKAPCPRKCNNL